MVKYSFLVPVYNVEKLVDKCVQSILSQERIDCSYEIILVDDGSTDSSGTICDRFAESYSNISCIHQANQGLLMARGTGVKAASGEYLLFVDSDDYIEKNLLAVVDKYINEYKPDFLNFGYIQNKGEKRLNNPITTLSYEEIGKKEILKRFAGTERYNSIWSKCVRSDILKDHYDEIYSIQTNIGEDKLQTAFLIKYSDRVLLINDCLYHYVLRDDSIVHKKKEEDIYKIIDIYDKVEKVMYDVMSGLDLNEKEKSELLADYKSVAVDGTLEHIYKYNKRSDVTSKDKAKVIHRIMADNAEFWSIDKRIISKLALYNRIRYKLLKRNRVALLISIDHILFNIQKLQAKVSN